jgi:hypothetical protein
MAYEVVGRSRNEAAAKRGGSRLATRGGDDAQQIDVPARGEREAVSLHRSRIPHGGKEREIPVARHTWGGTGTMAP